MADDLRFIEGDRGSLVSHPKGWALWIGSVEFYYRAEIEYAAPFSLRLA